MENWEREEAEFYDWLEEREQERWDRDSLARMKDSAFGVALEIRRFLKFSDCLIKKEMAGDSQYDVRDLWKDVGETRLNTTLLSRWLERTDSFSVFTARVRALRQSQPSVDREVRAVQFLLKSWVDEITVIALDDYAPWQGIVFFYSIESALATLVYLLSSTNITSHADILNSFRSLIIAPLRTSLFAPLDFTYRRLKGKTLWDWKLCTNAALGDGCPTIVRLTVEKGRHGDWVTYFHLLHTISELYRYRSALPYLMTSKSSLRDNGVFYRNLLLAIKLWLEVMITEAIGQDMMADLIKMARYRLSRVHKLEISTLEMRWEVMQAAGILDLSTHGLSDRTHLIFQSIRRNPLSMDW